MKGIDLQFHHVSHVILCDFQSHTPGAIGIIHVLLDKSSQSLIFKSPVFQPQVNLKVSLNP